MPLFLFRSGVPRTLGTAAVLLCLQLRPHTAFCQSSPPSNIATAQALYNLAVAEMDRKEYAPACKKLEEAVRLVPEGLGVKMTLGECYEKLGKLATAWSQFAVVKALAARQGQTDRVEAAEEAASKLWPRLSTLVIDVPDDVRATPGLRVTRDGEQVGEGQWKTTLPVDTGTHEIEASAPGYEPFRRKVEIPRDGVASRIEIEPLKLTFERAMMRPAGLTAGAVGIAGIGVGATFGLLAIDRDAESKRDGRCSPVDQCSAEGHALRNEALLFGNASTVAFAAGAALLAGGIVLLALAPSPVKALREPEKASRGSSPAATLSHRWQLGAITRADIEGQGRGVAGAFGLSLGLWDHLEVQACALVGQNAGVEPGLTGYFLRGMVKPLLSVGVPIFFVDGAWPGVRASTGVLWDATRHFGVLAQAGASFFPGAPKGYENIVFVPSIGVQGRL